MPVLVNIAVNLAFGGALAWVLRASPALRAELLTWPFLGLLGFEALVFTPLATYLFRFYPQWSMLYWFDPQLFPDLDRWVGVLSAVAVLLNFAAACAGYLAVRRSLLLEQRWLAYVPFAVATLLGLWVLASFGRRVVFIGDYDEFWQGHAKFLLLRVGGWVGVLLYGATASFVWYLRRRFAHHEPRFL